MNAPQHGRRSEPLPDPSTTPITGWHCAHYFYRFTRQSRLDAPCQQQLRDALHPSGEQAPERLAAYWTSGHRADFGIMVMDSDPAKVDAVHQSIMAPGLGGHVQPEWSFVSMSEVSEYVPSLEGYRARLIAGGADPDSEELAAKMTGYERRSANDERTTFTS